MEKLFGLETYPYESSMGIAWRLRDRACISATALRMMYNKSERTTAGLEGTFPPTGSDESVLAPLGPVQFLFKFCWVCLADGYHSVWHQAEALVLCPIHHCNLSVNCECCREPVGVYDRFGTAARHAFICNNCNGPISGCVISVRDNPSNTEIYSLSLTTFSKLDQWATRIVEIANASGSLKNYPFLTYVSGRKRFSDFLRFNTPLPFTPEHFSPFPDMIFIRFQNRPTDISFRIRNAHPAFRWFEHHQLLVKFIINRLADAFDIDYKLNPNIVILGEYSPPALALAVVQLMFDFSQQVGASQLLVHLELVGREVVKCTANRFEFIFRLLALFSELLLFFSCHTENQKIPTAELQHAVDQLTTYAYSSPTRYCSLVDVKDCRTATLALPLMPGFVKLTSRGIFTRWTDSFLAIAAPKPTKAA